MSLLLVAASTMFASAQKSVVAAALNKGGIDQSLMEPSALKVPAGYVYDMKESTTTAGKIKEVLAHFDPTAAGDEKWTVTSVNGNAPSSGDVKTFRKNRPDPQSVEKADDASYKIERPDN